MDDVTAFENFIRALAASGNETQKREAFVVLAATGFHDVGLARDLALGAEYQVRFHQAGLVRRGAIDSFYQNLIIEFENHLAKTHDHALEQLRAYAAGAWNEEGSTNRPYLVVATDGNAWEVLVPETEAKVPLATDDITLRCIESLIVTGVEHASDLREFLNRLFYREFKLRPTSSNFARDFGLQSPAFLGVEQVLRRKLSELRDDPQLEVLKDNWSKALQLAYGGVETPDDLFIRHTYLAVLARILVWVALERRDLEPREVNDVLSGVSFLHHRVLNMVEDDFFSWHTIESGTDVSRSWAALSGHINGYDLGEIHEDVLKPLYEELVDPETRHDLGEYYTPDWLAYEVTDSLLSTWTEWPSGIIPRILDPACGSGTFLRASLRYVRERSTKSNEELLSSLLQSVTGIDVHPLAVIIARATYLLAIHDLLAHASEAVAIPVYLADTLQEQAIVRQGALFGESDTMHLEVGEKTYPVPFAFVLDAPAYDATINDVVRVARAFGAPKTRLADAAESFANQATGRLKRFEVQSPGLIATLGALTVQLSSLIRNRRDSVYGFMLKNYYRPAMLRESVDYVIGNPPWLTVGDIAEPKYKARVLDICRRTNIAPRAVGEQAHTELATVFLAHVAQRYVKRGALHAQIALVMPRSVMTASHHRNLREGTYGDPSAPLLLEVTGLWDLSDVVPVFNIPSCVLFARAADFRGRRELSGRWWEGHLPARDLATTEARPHLVAHDATFELVFLGQRSAWRRVRVDRPTLPAERSPHATTNAYSERFRQGAILYPQSLIIVRPESAIATGPVFVRTDADAAERGKVLKEVRLHRVVDAESLFLTASASHIYPYTSVEPLWCALLPVATRTGQDDFGPIDADDLRRRGLVHTAEWLDEASALWESRRKRDDAEPWFRRLDHLGHLSAQRGMRRYVTLYIASGTRPMACVIDTARLDRPFVARDGTYWASFDRALEAHYVCAFLNSDFAADRILDWMNLGLFGPRHIHKRVLDVPWPTFDPDDASHAKLASVASSLASFATSALSERRRTTVGLERARLRIELPKDDVEHVEGLTREIAERVD